MMNLKDLGRSGCGLIDVLSQYMHAGTEKSNKNLNQDSNQAPAEYKCTVLLLRQRARLQIPTVVVAVAVVVTRMAVVSVPVR
jgi:hypothetical protein